MTPVTSVTTFKNWWQLGFHPKFAIDTLSFYSVYSKCIENKLDPLSRFDRTTDCDGQTDRQTPGHAIYRAM